MKRRISWPAQMVLLAVGLALGGSPVAVLASEEHDGEHAESGDDHGEKGIQLSAEELDEFGIELGVAGPGEVSRFVTLPAEVRPNQDRLAHIAPRFPGIAREVRKRVGDRVHAGETLAIVESSTSLAPYALKAEIAGTVIERHITQGEPVSQERGRAFTVADLSEVWVDISVYQKHLPYVHVGQPVRISSGHGSWQGSGLISYVSPVVDEATRTATARVVLPNPDGIWRPGLFVSAVVEVERMQVAVAAPRSALEVVEGDTVVFVRDDDGFEPRVVTIGVRGAEFVEITRGLEVGDDYVTRGGFTLKSELAREELSGGHSH